MSDERTTPWSAEIETVYQDQGRELWALFYAQCSNPETAYDALQEAFARLHEQNGTPIRDVRAWLLQVGRNWIRDVARRQRVAAKPSEHLDRLADPREGAESLLERRELHAQVRSALSELKDEDREVLVLRYSLGWSSNRMAIALNTTAAAIDMRLSRARRRLAERLQEMGVGHESLE
ncbi:MAG: sigma-70 family RNA polymerase sigma factor [Planctomycetaceae bacterium]